MLRILRSTAIDTEFPVDYESAVFVFRRDNSDKNLVPSRLLAAMVKLFKALLLGGGGYNDFEKRRYPHIFSLYFYTQ